MKRMTVIAALVMLAGCLGASQPSTEVVLYRPTPARPSTFNGTVKLALVPAKQSFALGERIVFDVIAENLSDQFCFDGHLCLNVQIFGPDGRECVRPDEWGCSSGGFFDQSPKRDLGARIRELFESLERNEVLAPRRRVLKMNDPVGVRIANSGYGFGLKGWQEDTIEGAVDLSSDYVVTEPGLYRAYFSTDDCSDEASVSFMVTPGTPRLEDELFSKLKASPEIKWRLDKGVREGRPYLLLVGGHFTYVHLVVSEENLDAYCEECGGPFAAFRRPYGTTVKTRVLPLTRIRGKHIYIVTSDEAEKLDPGHVDLLRRILSDPPGGR